VSLLTSRRNPRRSKKSRRLSENNPISGNKTGLLAGALLGGGSGGPGGGDARDPKHGAGLEIILMGRKGPRFVRGPAQAFRTCIIGAAFIPRAPTTSSLYENPGCKSPQTLCMMRKRKGGGGSQGKEGGLMVGLNG